MGLFRFLKQGKNKSNTPQEKLSKMDLKTELDKFQKNQARQIQAGISPYESIDEKKGFVYQNNAIVDYKNKNFDSAKSGFLKAINDYNFYTPGGVNYLAKIYRKEKDYNAEIELVEKALTYFCNRPEVNWSQPSIAALKHRLERAKELAKKHGERSDSSI